MKNFPERLRELRTAKGISEIALSKIIGVSNSTINAWENNVYDIKSEYLIRLAKFFNVTAGYLLGIED